jgi:peptidoglycan/LPS O-acetylase OafA/YrhL
MESIIVNTKHLTHPKYRADIDGLRAIAVLSVVGFHAFPDWIKGGFIGVDIFFVISGFLISTIIVGSLERNSFSFVEFYIRRIKRIFPALLLVLIASFAFGWFVLLADEYKQLGKHIAGGAGFVSNYLFRNESGYFDNAAEAKPLLHLWSLGIEEQYYIIWPLLLWLGWKLRFNLLTVTIAVTMISFALNVSKVHGDAVAAFYSPQTRFWELMVGSILAYMTQHKQTNFPKLKHTLGTWANKIIYAQASEANGQLLGNTLSMLGAVLIVIGILVVTKEKFFPGWWAVLPALGAMLIILAGAQAWLNRVVLSNRVLVWLGLISFPLYLWHWPLLAFAHIVEADTPSFAIRLAVVLISIVLAWLTYSLIERPIHFGKHGNAKAIVLLGLMIVVGYVGYNSYERDVLGFRLKDRQEYSDYFENSVPRWQYFEKEGISEKFRFDCDFYDLEKYRIGQATQVPRKNISKECFERSAAYSHAVFIWGDSHAQQLYPGLKNNLPPSWQILQVASSGCPPNANFKEPSTADYCAQSNWVALDTIEKTKPDVVIIAQNIGHNAESIGQIAEKLKSLGVRRVIIPGPTPHWTSVLPKIIVRKLWVHTPRRTSRGVDQKVISDSAILHKNIKETDSVVFVDVIDLFCNQEGCLTYLGDDRKTGITSWDYGHLTPIASDYLAKNLLVKVMVGNQ